jgi:hypothetical protein
MRAAVVEGHALRLLLTDRREVLQQVCLQLEAEAEAALFNQVAHPLA